MPATRHRVTAVVEPGDTTARAQEESAEGFLARWSRRKTAARQPPPEPAIAAPPAEPPTLPDPPSAPADEPEAERPHLELPDIDTLDAASDFKPFMRPGVPAELQTAALRKLWRANPIFGELDGLDDCCGDFTDAAVCAGPVKTVYQIGRGMVDAVSELAERLAADGSPSPDRAPLARDASEECLPASPEMAALDVASVEDLPPIGNVLSLESIENAARSRRDENER